MSDDYLGAFSVSTGWKSTSAWKGIDVSERREFKQTITFVHDSFAFEYAERDAEKNVFNEANVVIDADLLWQSIPSMSRLLDELKRDCDIARQKPK